MGENMINYFKVFFMIVFIVGCKYSQANTEEEYQLIGGQCEGCEAVFEFGNDELSPTDTLPDFFNSTQKLKLSGKIFQPDGITPASDVILYIYHTDENGIYTTADYESGWGKRHGYNRGWIKTGIDGQYTFYAIVPGSYPNRTQPAHIHPTILEPDGKYYWLDSYFFDGDPLLENFNHISKNPRGGGSNIISLEREGDLMVGEQNIILRKNVPNK